MEVVGFTVPGSIVVTVVGSKVVPTLAADGDVVVFDVVLLLGSKVETGLCCVVLEGAVVGDVVLDSVLDEGAPVDGIRESPFEDTVLTDGDVVAVVVAADGGTIVGYLVGGAVADGSSPGSNTSLVAGPFAVDEALPLLLSLPSFLEASVNEIATPMPPPIKTTTTTTKSISQQLRRRFLSEMDDSKPEIVDSSAPS
jgi:hypothetical protein